MKSFIVCAALFVALVDAVAFQGPLATPGNEAPSSLFQGWTPRPTQKSEVYGGLLKKRVNSGEIQVGFYAPDNTCGYISGSFGASKYCSDTETCVVLTTGIVGTVAGCCADINHCFFATDCVNSEQYFSGTICPNVCQADDLILKCTDATAPYCYGYSFTDWGASLYSCNIDQGTGLDIIETTFLGEPDGRTWNPLYITKTTSSPLANSSASSTSPASNSTSPPPPPPNTHKSTPVGAIAGGVVGGLAIIGAIVAGFVYMCLRDRHRRRSDEAGNYGQYPPTTQAEPLPADKPGFQAQTQPHYMGQYQQLQPQLQPPTHLQPGYAPYPGQVEAISPPLSPAPQYSTHAQGPVERPGSMVKPDITVAGTAATQQVAQLDAPADHTSGVPPVHRDGHAVFEIST